MSGPKKYITGILMNGAKIAVFAFSILGIIGPLVSCADLREEFNPSKWHYRPYPDAAPSWEEDFGRPPDMNSGETPFQ